MLGSCGENVTVQSPVSFLYGKHTSIGHDVFINGNCTIQDSALVSIGDRVVIAPDVKLFCGNHAVDARERWKRAADGSLKLVTTTKPITIGSDVWIGGGVIVVPGVTVGSNVVVGTGAVVTRDVPDNCVVAGVPARVIRALEPLEDVTEGTGDATAAEEDGLVSAAGGASCSGGSIFVDTADGGVASERGTSVNGAAQEA